MLEDIISETLLNGNLLKIKFALKFGLNPLGCLTLTSSSKLSARFIKTDSFHVKKVVTFMKVV